RRSRDAFNPGTPLAFLQAGRPCTGPDRRRERLPTTHTLEQDSPPLGDTVFDMARATVVLPTTPPFRLDLTIWALRRRKKNAVDRWDDGQYRRIIVADGDPVRLTVTQETDGVEP